MCAADFAGRACDVPAGPWRLVDVAPHDRRLARMAHSLVRCDDRTLYMFGGYTLDGGALNDLWSYDVTSGGWTELTGDGRKPPARWAGPGSKGRAVEAPCAWCADSGAVSAVALTVKLYWDSK